MAKPLHERLAEQRQKEEEQYAEHYTVQNAVARLDHSDVNHLNELKRIRKERDRELDEELVKSLQQQRDKTKPQQLATVTLPSIKKRRKAGAVKPRKMKGPTGEAAGESAESLRAGAQSRENTKTAEKQRTAETRAATQEPPTGEADGRGAGDGDARSAAEQQGASVLVDYSSD